MVCYNDRLAMSLQRNIMRTLKFASFFIVCAAALVVPFSAHAQQAQPQSLDAPPPPKLEKLEEGSAPGVTIREPKNQQTIKEKRAPGGKVTEIEVSKGKNTYYLKPNVAPGSALPGDVQSPQSRPAQWKVYEFNKKKKSKESQVDVAPPSLPPAAETPAKK